jgi:predicted RNA binding protein YcfA (HicA-like mRNA interferase family)
MNAVEVEHILQKYGFELISQKGSHRKWRNSEEEIQVIVPDHKARDLPVGTLRNILITANIPESEWKTE